MKLLCPFVITQDGTYGSATDVLWVNPDRVVGVRDLSVGRNKQAVIYFDHGGHVIVKGDADSVTDSLLNLAEATPVPGGAS